MLLPSATKKKTSLSCPQKAYFLDLFWGCLSDNIAQMVLKARVLYSCEGVCVRFETFFEAIVLGKVVMVHVFVDI